MSNYASQEYTDSKIWVSKKITDGFDWESVKLMCTSPDKAEELFYKLRDEDLLIMEKLEGIVRYRVLRTFKKYYVSVIKPQRYTVPVWTISGV